MSTIDIRTTSAEPVDEIVFADRTADDGSYQAFRLSPHIAGNCIKIADATGEYVYVDSEDHARNLIKALEKAIELGWLK